ncbi:DNA-processing protein DprA [Microvirga massiliensis]|uniref:DNA-processing protein DprA n=1 Tax=Microvirga massiliensis TaxID=1033741 RepID=UPI00062B7A1C|nr:DNA-processing protein DprA [Microvirga massiliensis]
MTATVLSDAERLDWLRLIRSDHVGPRTFRLLVTRFGSATAALDALPDLARRNGRAVRIPSRVSIEAEMAAGARAGIRYVALGEPLYPKPLQAIDTAPPVLAVRGDLAILQRPAVAIVGSRNASATGLAMTERLARGLGEAGLVVVSGLARGIDTRAHRASLGSGTIAVLAGGHDRIYPAENKSLAEAILDAGGALVSEMPLGCEPRAKDFPRRNRIVSGLSYGTIVVEAARHSGSLITARLALEQGREVFAIPGSPLDPRAEGTNDLIREGATLRASADHVTAALKPLIANGLAVQDPLLARDRHAEEPQASFVWDGDSPEAPDEEGPAPIEVVTADPVESLLGAAPVSIDELVRLSGLPIRVVQTTLLELELRGRLERHGGNSVSLVPER